MSKIAKETAGQVLSFTGLVLAAVTCGIPLWRVTYYVGANIETGQIIWDGLWMRCVTQSTGQMQCSIDNNIMNMTQDLQTARALVIICLVIGLIGFLISFVGAKCTSCLKTDLGNAVAVVTAGFLLIMSAIALLIPVCWSASTTITDYSSNAILDSQRREIGASIYIGWASSGIILIGGIILTTSCPPQRKFYPNHPVVSMYPYAPAANAGPVYAPPSRRLYTPSGSYVPPNPPAAPTTYSPRQHN